MFFGIRAPLVVPLKHHVLAFVIRQALLLAVAVYRGKTGRRIADLDRKR
jgi:hypothetical protein